MGKRDHRPEGTPGFADEPRSGQGLHWSLRQPDNRRPNRRAPGTGRRDYLDAQPDPPAG